MYPEIAKEWHPTKNGNLTPRDITAGSDKRIWWICSKDRYEWQVEIYKRSSGQGCPRCNSGWSINIIKNTIESIGKSEIINLTQAERYAIFLASGAVRSKHKDVIRNIISSGKLPDDFVEEEEDSKTHDAEVLLCEKAKSDPEDKSHSSLDVPTSKQPEVRLKASRKAAVSNAKMKSYH